MRPDRAVVKKAILDSGGNLTESAILLGCSRTALYTWIYQFGLEKFAGVRLDTRDALDRRECKDTIPDKPRKSAVNSAFSGLPTLRVVESQAAAATDFPIQASLRIRESLWKRVKIEAIQRNTTVGALVGAALEIVLAAEAKPKRKKGEEGA